MRDLGGGGPWPPPKFRSDDGADLDPASGAGRLSSGELNGSSWNSGMATHMESSPACRGMPLHGMLYDHMEEGEATPDVDCVLEGTVVRHMAPTSGGWTASSGGIDPTSSGLEKNSLKLGGPLLGDNDVRMVEREYSNLLVSVFGEHAPSHGVILPVGSESSSAGTGEFSDGVLNGFRAQTSIQVGQGLHGDLSAHASLGGDIMHGAGNSFSASHVTRPPGVRQNATHAFEKQNRNVSCPTAIPSPWRSHASVWSRPKVIPMPSKEDLGQISKDGTTALLDDGEIDAALKKMEGALVGRMFGRKIPYPQLSRELKRRWEGFGSFRLIMLSSDCFICIFDCVAARDAILMEGPWVIFGQVLGLDRWSPSFSPSSSDGFLTPVWVRMPELPFFCWTATNIARIVALIGEPLWIDSATDQLERGLFARACVRLDLSKPLQAGLWIEGKLGKFFQPLEYEGLSMFCFRCSQVGHKAISCKLPTSNSVNDSCSNVPLPDVVSAKPTALDSSKEDLHGHSALRQALGNIEAAFVGDAVLQASLSVEDRGAGPWMLVARKRRPNKGRANGVLRQTTLQATATGKLGFPHNAAGRSKQYNNSLRNNSQQVQDGETFGNCHIQGAGWIAKQQVVKDVHANSAVHDVAGEQPAFGGFMAMATSGVMKLSARRKDVRVDGMGTAVPPVSPSPCSQDIVVDSCATPKPSMHMDEHSLAVSEPNSSSSPNVALVLYNSQDDRMKYEIKSLKKEKMLNDLGPISLTPRKRRMIALNHDGGDASSLPTS